MKIAIALSGGVDSAVAGALLKEQGHELVGVTALVWPDSRCCDAQALSDAGVVAKALDIPYFTVDVMAEFRNKVVDPFVSDYYHGRTPNPCPLCNTQIRFGTMWEKILQQHPDCEAVATGHYARISSCSPAGGARSISASAESSKNWTLQKGIDAQKDQAYMLYGLSQEQLSRTLTPLGTYTKDEVRKLAEKYGLFVSKKPDSQDACFVSGDYKRFLQEYAQFKADSGWRMADARSPSGVEVPIADDPAGDIVDTSGQVIGQHKGVFNFTIGQRKGLELKRAGADNAPLFVVALKPEQKQVVVGTFAESLASECMVKELNWIIPQGESLIHSTVKIRYNADEVESLLTLQADGRVHCRFKSPQRAVTPGQNAVFYDGDYVLGGGVIEGNN